MNDTPSAQALDPRQLQAIQIGPAQTWRHITLFPLLGAENGAPEYLTLSEALAGGQLTVAEVSQAGSVPELKAVNAGETPVLLLDGEELAGAKQNRVLNTTILLPGKSGIVVPVSCTEQGRWRSTSENFCESGVLMSHKVRVSKNSSVSSSLVSHASFFSDQAEVWRHIHELHHLAGTSSPTSAMLDAFKARETDLAKALDGFTLIDHQHGVLVLVAGRVLGFDWISRGAAYRQLHSKLLKSYVFDALLEEAGEAIPTGEARTLAAEFLKNIGTLVGQPFPSVGLGLDFRFKSKDVAGSALVCEGHAVHLGFFRVNPAESVPPMAGLHARRRWRA